MSITPPEIPVPARIRVSVSADGQDQHAACHEVEAWLRSRNAALELTADAAESALDDARRTREFLAQEPWEECQRPMPPPEGETRLPFEWYIYELQGTIAGLVAQRAELLPPARALAEHISGHCRSGLGLAADALIDDAADLLRRIDAGEFITRPEVQP